MSDDVLLQLAATIRARRAAAPDSSYTRQLLDAGPARCAKKLGEEAVETVIAGVGESDEALKEEAADLLYHLLVLLESRGVGDRGRARGAGAAPGRLGSQREGRPRQALIDL